MSRDPDCTVSSGWEFLHSCPKRNRLVVIEFQRLGDDIFIVDDSRGEVSLMDRDTLGSLLKQASGGGTP